MILLSILYYIVFASAVLFYGIGICRTLSVKSEVFESFLSCIKALSVSSSTVSISYLAIRWLLPKTGLFEFFPMIVMFVFLIITILIELFLDVGIKRSPAEFSITFLSSILAINESLSIAHAVVSACSCVMSFYMFLALFHSIRGRASFFFDPTGIKVYPILLLSLAVVIFAVLGLNNSFISLL